MSRYGFTLFFCLVAIGIVWAIVWNHQQSSACEARGGVWFQPYKSSGICLRPGSVVMP